MNRIQHTVENLHLFILEALGELEALSKSNKPLREHKHFQFVLKQVYNLYHLGHSAPYIVYLETADAFCYHNFICQTGVIRDINNIIRIANNITGSAITDIPHPRYIDCDDDDSGCDESDSDCQQEYSSYSPPAKNTTIKFHNKYFDKHLKRCQGLRTKDIPCLVLESVREHIRPLTKRKVKAFLKRTYPTYANEYVYIYGLLSGETEPKLSAAERADITNAFKHVVDKLHIIEPGRSVSYRFILYKLIDLFVEDDSERKKALLLNIKLPKPETLKRLDGTWQRVCESIERLEFTPTIKPTNNAITKADAINFPDFSRESLI